MAFYRATLTYKGASYFGWQVQPNARTVQGELNRAIAVISKTEEVKTIGSGRTDAGVHALGQVVRIETPLVIQPQSLLKALNTQLPPDIRVVDCVQSDENFHPTYQAESKWYSYFFCMSEYPDPLVGDLIAHFSFEADVEKMQKAASVFVGEHDFQNFYTEGTPVSSSVRKIYSCEIFEISDYAGLPFPTHRPCYEVRIHGNGFLKQMVRMIVGAIWSHGRGKIELQDIQRALGAAQKERISPVAPPEGLYLMRVVYPPN